MEVLERNVRIVGGFEPLTPSEMDALSGDN
jgi:hypothetical protein